MTVGLPVVPLEECRRTHLSRGTEIVQRLDAVRRNAYAVQAVAVKRAAEVTAGYGILEPLQLQGFDFGPVEQLELGIIVG